MQKNLDNLFKSNCEFIVGAQYIKAIPDDMNLPEFAICGLSNVGKSSLINALTYRKTLAKTSQNPGHTKQLNFFKLADTVNLVDMPGYGYAKVSKKELERFDNLIKKYLKGRPQLKRVYILLDARRGIKESDIKMMNIMNDLAVSYQIVLTKIDYVLNKKQLANFEKNPEDIPLDLQKVMDEISGKTTLFPALHPVLIATSAKENIGLEMLRGEIRSLISNF